MYNDCSHTHLLIKLLFDTLHPLLQLVNILLHRFDHLQSSSTVSNKPSATKPSLTPSASSSSFLRVAMELSSVEIDAASFFTLAEWNEERERKTLKSLCVCVCVFVCACVCVTVCVRTHV